MGDEKSRETKGKSRPIRAVGQVPRGRLTLDEIERLPPAEFAALPEGERLRYFDHMTRENSPSAREFYGYDEEVERPNEADQEAMDEYYRERAERPGTEGLH